LPGITFIYPGSYWLWLHFGFIGKPGQQTT
jgi:hypothetical protein